MNRRVFVALLIPPPLQDEIMEWEKCLAKLPVRWLKGKNLHITLVPPWDEENPETAAVALETLRGAAPSFTLRFEEVIFGPDNSRPRLIWAGGKTPPQLTELKTKIEKVVGKEPDSRPFRLHLTLARFRPEAFSNFLIKELKEPVAWSADINSFALMESYLLPAGAEYKMLREIALS